MGQEASLPANQGESLEEQAKSPPSTSYNDPVHSAAAAIRGGGMLGGSERGSRSSRKIMGAMFRHNITHPSGDTCNQNTISDYEHKEIARAAAMDGNMYMNSDGTSDDFINGDSSYVNQHQESFHTPAHHDHDVTNSSYPPPMQSHLEQHPNPVAVEQQSTVQQQSVIGILLEKQSSAKKGLFSNIGTRSVINTMRNLTLTTGIRKQKDVDNWEKQWDEDDDDSDSEQVDPKESETSIQKGLTPYGIQDTSIRSPQKVPDSSSTQQQSAPVRTTVLEQGVNTPGSIPLSNLEMQQHTDPACTMPVSPPRIQLQHLQVSPTSPSCEPIQLTHAEPEDLLSKPTSDGLSPPRQSAAAVDNENVDWENVLQQKGSSEENGCKPNIQMFMPMLRVLGKGSFGKVVLVQKREGKERGQLFAMKILKKTHLVKRRQIERTRTERKVLSVVNHPFIMKLHYAFQSEDKLYLVLDYCPGGELFFHLSRFRRFPERVARFYSAELLLAIGHLHKRGIIYRDLKPENVLLDAEGHLKLGDFGLAKAGITHPLTGASSMCGTPEYMAPEVLSQSGHGFCVDYWGLGMIVYEMMTGLPPWYTTDRQQLFRRLKSAPLDIPSYFSIASANCVSALLERNPRRRLGVSGIRTAMEHEFFRNISWRALYSRRVEAPVRPCEGWRPPEPVSENNDVSVPLTTDNNTHFSRTAPGLYRGEIEHLDSADLDSATQNFDNQFTRMPVDSEDQIFDPAAEGINPEELNERTFRGFSFDIVKHREEEAAALAAMDESTNSLLDSSQALRISALPTQN